MSLFFTSTAQVKRTAVTSVTSGFRPIAPSKRVTKSAKINDGGISSTKFVAEHNPGCCSLAAEGSNVRRNEATPC